MADDSSSTDSGAAAASAGKKGSKEPDKKRITVTVGEKGPVKIPGGIIIIVFGLLLLWLATTGQLKRFGQWFDWLRSNSDVPGPQLQPATAKLSQAVPVIMDTPTYHVSNLLADSDAPGGMY